MHRFLRQLITEWRKLDLPTAETLVVAVSGGADSVSLLLALDELNKIEKLDHRLLAAHFNHDLRGEESDADEAFVRDLASERNLELAVGHSGTSARGNLEQNARNERYDFLGKTAENVKAFAVLTGHTINDQAETFLLNLIRGSGTRGLSGMRPIRKLRASASAETVLVRPLLDWAYRQDTEQFCHDLGVEYRYDTMNEDEAFKRVRIRKVLLPLLEDFNPRIVDRLADTARLLQVRSIDEAPEIDASDLSLAEINSLEKPVLYTTIRSWIEANRGNLRQIGLKHIEAIDRLIHSRKSGKTVELPGGATVEKKAGRLTFRKN